MTEKLIKIFSEPFYELQQRNFSYMLTSNKQSVLGILCSDDTSLSLALKNGAGLKVAEMELYFSNQSVPPNKRILRINEFADGRLVLGTVSNLRAVHTPVGDRIISIYLLVEEDE